MILARCYSVEAAAMGNARLVEHAAGLVEICVQAQKSRKNTMFTEQWFLRELFLNGS